MLCYVDEEEHPLAIRRRINEMPMVKQLNLKVRGFNGPEEYHEVPNGPRLQKYTVMLELDRVRTTQALHASIQQQLAPEGTKMQDFLRGQWGEVYKEQGGNYTDMLALGFGTGQAPIQAGGASPPPAGSMAGGMASEATKLTGANAEGASDPTEPNAASESAYLSISGASGSSMTSEGTQV